MLYFTKYFEFTLCPLKTASFIHKHIAPAYIWIVMDQQNMW